MVKHGNNRFVHLYKHNRIIFFLHTNTNFFVCLLSFLLSVAPSLNPQNMTRPRSSSNVALSELDSLLRRVDSSSTVDEKLQRELEEKVFKICQLKVVIIRYKDDVVTARNLVNRFNFSGRVHVFKGLNLQRMKDLKAEADSVSLPIFDIE